MLVLFETSAGYALFKITNEDKLQNAEDVAAIFQNTDKAKKL